MESKLGREETDFLLCLPAGSFGGVNVWVTCAKMCDSKAYSLTKRQLISAQRQISRSVLIKVSEKFEIPSAQQHAEKCKK